jgi:pilus assembly protein CpaD
MRIENTTVRGPHKIRPVIAKIIALALVPAALGGCEHDQAGAQVASWTLLDPEERHPILVSQQPANLSLHVASASQGLTPVQRARVMEFVSRSKVGDEGNSRFVISAPGGSANESAAMDAAEEVRQLMLAGGYSETAIAVEPYRASGGEAPLRVSYLRYVAEAPDCGQDWSQNLAANYQNTPYPNFGCAAQRNLAVMVANPADLLGPRTMTIRDSNRRDVAFAKYVKGDQTGASVEAATIGKVNN